MIIVYDKETHNVIGIATRVFDNGRLREPSMEELYPHVDRSNWDCVFVEDHPKYALEPGAWKFKVDDKNKPVGVERKPQPPRIMLTTDAPDDDGDGIPEINADGRSTAIINATVMDARGNLMRNHVKLMFRTTGGTLSRRYVTARRGKATVELRSTQETILVTVSALAEGMKTATLSFEFLPPDPSDP